MDKVDLYIEKNMSGGGIRWDELYDTEEDLIEDLLKTSNKVRGWQYVVSYKRKLRNNVKLSSKEITQIKRLARFIFKDVNKL